MNRRLSQRRLSQHLALLALLLSLLLVGCEEWGRQAPQGASPPPKEQASPSLPSGPAAG